MSSHWLRKGALWALLVVGLVFADRLFSTAAAESGEAGEALTRFGDGEPVRPFPPFADGALQLRTNEVVVFVGQENMVREQKAGALESLLAAGFSKARPRFRFMAWEADTVYEQWRELNFGPWIDQLNTAEAGVVIAQFGQMEAFDGPERLTEFKAAYHRLLDQFAQRTRRMVLISPMPLERPLAPQAPDLTLRNDAVALYAQAVEEVAQERGAIFVDLFNPLARRGADGGRLTRDGVHLTEEGLVIVAEIIAEQLGAAVPGDVDLAAVRSAIVQKNRLWFDSWRPANWSFAYGDRVSQAFGKSGGDEPSLHESFAGRRPLIEAWDRHIQALAEGGREAPPAPEPERQVSAKAGQGKVLSPEEEEAGFTLAEGYQVNLFASEADGVVNPVQISWDERGRLFVACSPSYPQALAGVPPGDFILVLEDMDRDGKADRSWKFAEGLRMVQGVEPGAGGLYVCDFDQLLFLRDSDGDGREDEREVLFSGFGIGDTHQLINSISHGIDGSLWFTQGLHAMSLVETPWGIARLDRAGVWRLRPRTLRLEGFFGGGMAGANCWGVAVDDYGQVFHKSGDRPHGYWTVPGMVRGASPSGSGSRTLANQSYHHSPEQYHSVGPLFETSPKTTSLDILGTRALPEEIQGCALIAGYFGSVVELHRFQDAGSGYKTEQLPRLLTSAPHAFRPVDVSQGPDGGIYVADWYNPVIGHYQASYADPQRDKRHGRIWRISARGYAPVRVPALGGMSAVELIDQLTSPERWIRYQAKRLLFYRPTAEVIAAADERLARSRAASLKEERFLLELAGVYHAHEKARPELLEDLLGAADFRVRAYGALMAGYWADQLEAPVAVIQRGLRDEHPRVRLCAVVAASYVGSAEAAVAATEVLRFPMDPFLEYALRQSTRAMQEQWRAPLQEGRLDAKAAEQEAYLRQLAGEPDKPVFPGAELYGQACLVCHQPEGKGLPGVYPPLAGSERVTGDPEDLIRIVLHGLSRSEPLADQALEEVAAIAMPRFSGLTDPQIAELLTFLRESFGNEASPIGADQVRAVRDAFADRAEPWTVEELEGR